MSPRARVSILVVFLSLAALLVIGRLFTIAVIDHGSYIAKAQKQQQVVRDIIPRRGTIYLQDAAAGTPSVIAESVERFALSATPHNVTHKAEYALLLADIAQVDSVKLKETFDKDGMYMEPILHNLDKTQVETIANRIVALEKTFNRRQGDVPVNFDPSQGNILQYLGGVFFIREFDRVYPEPQLLGQVLGFVNDKGAGQYGFEAQYDTELKGYTGRIALERDSRGTSLRQSDEVEGQDGTNYELTIDRNVQAVVEQELAKEVQQDEAKSGSVIILDPKTGGVIAMANYPTYNVSDFRQVAKDDITKFDNPSVSAIWEPGSIFKTLIMGAALDQGAVTPTTTDVFPASVTVNGYEINTALNKAFGKESMTDVLVNSDNVAMVWIGNKLGNQPMGEYLQKLGLGTVTGIDLKNEVAGKVNPWQRWSDVNRATITFGQGIAVTPIQIAAAYAAIANDGVLLRPHVVAASIGPDGTRKETTPSAGTRVYKSQTAAELRMMLEAVVSKNHKRAGVPGYVVGGKTGTAQVPDPEHGGYIADAYNHSFAGMAPIDNPRYVMLVKIDQPNLAKAGQFAESTAVPLFGRLSRFLLHYYQIPPIAK